MENTEYLDGLKQMLDGYKDSLRNICDLCYDFLELEVIKKHQTRIDGLDEGLQHAFDFYWFKFQSFLPSVEENVENYNFIFQRDMTYIYDDVLETYSEMSEFYTYSLTFIHDYAHLESLLVLRVPEYQLGEITSNFITSLRFIIKLLIDPYIYQDEIVKMFDLVFEQMEDIEREEYIKNSIFSELRCDEVNNEEGDNNVNYHLPDVSKVNKKQEKKWNLEELLAELNELVGMKSLKVDIENMVNFIKVQKMRKERGMKSIAISNHLVFIGNPGTGKTTVARLVAKIYKTIGLLSTGNLVETDRAGLVAGYVGQTAIKTEKIIEKSIGGVLFIDEAYTLANDEFGQEAIETLLKRMEDYRDNLIVIVAGYPENMMDLIHSNPGLQSRFNKYITFEDYTPEELLDIFKVMCKREHFELDSDALEIIYAYVLESYSARNERFSNARLMRNLLESSLAFQANRIVKEKMISDEDLSTINLSDIMQAIQ